MLFESWAQASRSLAAAVFVDSECWPEASTKGSRFCTLEYERPTEATQPTASTSCHTSKGGHLDLPVWLILQPREPNQNQQRNHQANHRIMKSNNCCSKPLCSGACLSCSQGSLRHVVRGQAEIQTWVCHFQNLGLSEAGTMATQLRRIQPLSVGSSGTESYKDPSGSSMWRKVFLGPWQMCFTYTETNCCTPARGQSLS